MKLENGAGSIVKLSGNRRKPYAVRITTGWKDGKQIRKYIGYYSEQTEAMLALAEYHKNGIDVDFTKLTLNDVYARYTERLGRDGATRSILSTHKMVCDRLDRLGNKLIKEIKTDHLQDWLDSVDLKAGTKKKLKGSLSQLFEYAFTNDMVSKNYAKAVKLKEKIEKTGSTFTEEEIKFLWDNKDEEMCRHLLILIYTGMRIGELLAVKVDHINFEEKYIIGGSKSEAGRDRVIPIHDAIMPLIRQQLENSKAIISKENGTGISYAAFKLRYDVFSATHKLNHKIHDTRKTAVSIMHSSGIPMEVVRMIVGHSGKGVTEQVYLYKEPKELVEWINRIEIV